MFDRVYKPIVAAIIMAVSIFIITGGRSGVALACAVIPLFFGLMRFLASIGYALTGIAVIGAVLTYAGADLMSPADRDALGTWARDQVATITHHNAVKSTDPATPETSP